MVKNAIPSPTVVNAVFIGFVVVGEWLTQVGIQDVTIGIQ
ncbi:unnamed protein product, partial [Linum tenue]